MSPLEISPHWLLRAGNGALGSVGPRAERIRVFLFSFEDGQRLDAIAQGKTQRNLSLRAVVLQLLRSAMSLTPTEVRLWDAYRLGKLL